jgi:hypothetical protein
MVEYLVEVSQTTMNSSCVSGGMILTKSRRLLESAIFFPSDRATTKVHHTFLPSIPTLCFSARPGTSAAIAAKSLPPCFRTAFCSLLSSSFDHLPVRRPILGSKTSFHLLRTELSFDTGPAQQLHPNSYHRAFAFLRFAVFVFCPFTCTPTCSADAGSQDNLPSVTTFICHDIHMARH